MPDDDLRLDVLGSLQARSERADGTTTFFDLGPPQRRTVLAVLLCGVREVISTGRLLDCVWAERAGASAVGALHSHVSHLRKAIGHETIVRHAHGYSLVVRPDQLDADIFSRSVQRGRSAIGRGDVRNGRQLLDDGLSLWRGRAYEEFDSAPWARREIVRLEAERLGALTARLDVDLELGDTDVVGELEALVVEHPLHEGFSARLMLALYRSGRQADALAAYRNHVDRLVETTGLAPTPSLRDLQLRILHHDPDLAGPMRLAGSNVSHSEPSSESPNENVQDTEDHREKGE